MGEEEGGEEVVVLVLYYRKCENSINNAPDDVACEMSLSNCGAHVVHACIDSICYHPTP